MKPKHYPYRHAAVGSISFDVPAGQIMGFARGFARGFAGF